MHKWLPAILIAFVLLFPCAGQAALPDPTQPPSTKELLEILIRNSSKRINRIPSCKEEDDKTLREYLARHISDLAVAGNNLINAKCEPDKDAWRCRIAFIHSSINSQDVSYHGLEFTLVRRTRLIQKNSLACIEQQ